VCERENECIVSQCACVSERELVLACVCVCRGIHARVHTWCVCACVHVRVCACANVRELREWSESNSVHEKKGFAHACMRGSQAYAHSPALARV